MESNLIDYYICSKCGKNLPKNNKLLHDLRCTEQINNNMNNNINLNNNACINFDGFAFLGSYKCEICGTKMQLKEKQDHLLCHQLEKNDKNQQNNAFLSNNNSSNSSISNDSDSDRQNQNSINPMNIRNTRNMLLRNNISSNNRNNFRINNRISIDYTNNRSNRRNRENNLEDSIDNSLDNSLENSLNNSLDNVFNDDLDGGLDDDIIETYPTSKIKNINNLSEDKKKCLICLENFKIGENSIILPCIHIFHSECIKKWMKSKNVCPICKSKIHSNNI